MHPPAADLAAANVVVAEAEGDMAKTVTLVVTAPIASREFMVVEALEMVL
jgi:hypothetical protein